MSSSSSSSTNVSTDSQLYELAIPDADNTLGGIKDDTQPEHPSVIGHLVKSLMPGQDLTRVTIPPFFLEPRSLLERMGDMLMHPDLLLNISEITNPIERMTNIVKWYLSGWHYKTLGVKKPFNPVIGETFACYWKHNDGSRSQFFAEQVLHRPPISAIYFENRPHNVVASAHVWTRSQFSAPQTTKSILDGACVLTLTNLNEEYYITFPTYYAHNLILGTLRMEIGDTAHIICRKTNLRCDIHFQQRSMWSDAALNGIEGHIYSLNKDGISKHEDLFHLTGHWDREIFITPTKGKQTLFLNVAELKVAPKYVLPLDQQGPWESRRLWQYAASELAQRPTVDWDAVDREKGQLEEEQRLLACHAKHGSAEYADWVTKKFHKKEIIDAVTGHNREMFIFDDIVTKPYSKDEPILNVLALSRNFPDVRGGLNGNGANAEVVQATKSITLSSRRSADLSKFKNE